MEDPKERNERIRSRLRVAAVFFVLALVVSFLIYFSLVALGRAPLPRWPERPAATAEPVPDAAEEPSASPTPSPKPSPTPRPTAEESSEEPSEELAEETAPTAATEPTPIPTAAPTATAVPTPIPTATPAPVQTMTPTATAASPVPTATATPDPTPEPMPTAMPAPTATPRTERDKSPILPMEPQSAGRWDWRLQIANYDLRLAEDFAPAELVEIESGQYVDARIEMPLREMFRDARNAGYSLYFCSGFRDYDTQASIYWRNVNNYMAWGYSYEDADAMTRLSVNVPGASEHQLGITADVLEYPGQDMLSYIGGSGLMAWLEKNCTRYGFIIRYPEGKTEITGVDYEPWHLRYVGTAAAEYITRNELCLEEFLQLYTQWQRENRTQSETAAESPESPASERGKNR